MHGTEGLKALLGELTLEEKASLCLGSDFWHTAPVARLGIPAIRLSDGPHGLRRAPDQGEQVTVGGSLPATCFPTAAALGSSFDPELAVQVGRAIAEEAQAQGVAVVLGPGVNIKRSPLCGRNFEYFSEDPYVAGVMGVALVQGLQEQGVGACLKHFAANNQETDRARVSADVDERALREIYLAAFERVVTEGRPWTVMCSYNKVNGVYASENHWLLTEVLRDEWDYQGLVMSDWGAVHDRVAAVTAGLDLEMPPNLGASDAALVAAVRAGELDEATLDASVARLLDLVDRVQAAGVQAAGVPVPGSFDQAAHHLLARAAAGECAVLLKNEGDLLPLQLSAGQKLAVLGEFARHGRFQGAGSSQINPTRLEVALDELREAVPEGVEVAFAPGYSLTGTGTGGAGAGEDDARLVEEAVALAAGATAVVLFMGLPEAEESEGYDRRHIGLPRDQVELLHAVAAVNDRVVVVLANGSVVQVSDWDADAGAILECWLLGQAAGGAVADILTGMSNPCGRLTETVPVRLEDNPSYLNFPGEYGHVRYGEGIFVGYRAYDKLGLEVSYPFGHGLSYTTFDYGELEVDQSGSHAAGDLSIRVSCRVTNSGRRAGKEVVQLYVGDISSTAEQPPRQLKGFTKLALEPGEHRRVTFTLRARDLSFWSVALHHWALEAGRFEISIGASSRDIRLSGLLDVDAPSVKPPLDHMSSLEEWLADPAGAAALATFAERDATGRVKGFLGDEEFVRLIGNFPVSSFAVVAGTHLDARTAAQLLASVK